MRKKSGFSYNGKVGHWWLRHSLDSAHDRAYKKISDFVRDSYVREPGTIVDYACGSGNLISLLSLRFMNSKIIGLDGSLFMLGEALRRISLLPEECSKRISLIKTPLPNFTLLRGKADLVIFCFPNMVPFSDVEDFRSHRARLCVNDRNIARSLSFAANDGTNEVADEEPAANQSGLEQGRCISLNLRRMLVPGGICIRVEYATMQRHELSPLELSHVSFEEGSLDVAVEGRQPSQWFRLMASAYFRSRVLEDVYEQTGDERDRKGGYLITVLRAI